jgi:hypothetical protein
MDCYGVDRYGAACLGIDAGPGFLLGSPVLVQVAKLVGSGINLDSTFPSYPSFP